MKIKKWMIFIVVVLMVAAFAVGCGGNNADNNDNNNNADNNNNNDEVVAGSSFDHPEKEDCMMCHSGIADAHTADFGADFEDRCLDCHEAI